MRNAKRLRASEEVGSQPSQDVEITFQPSQGEEVRSQPSQDREIMSQASQDREFMPQSSQYIEVRSQASQDEEIRSPPVELESARDTPPPEQNISLVCEAVADSSFEVTGDHENDDDEEEEEMDAQDVFDDWMLGLRKSQRKVLATLLFTSFKNQQKMSTMDAAQEAASITGFNEKTVRAYAKEFVENKFSFKETRQGKYERMCILNDEGLRERASEFVRENAFKKGEPNMTSVMFLEFVNERLLPSHHLSLNFPRSISLRTAIRWLHDLGFKPMSHKKIIYIDGHEREDVVKYRDEYLSEVHTMQQTHQHLPLCGDEPTPASPQTTSLSPSLSDTAPHERDDNKLVMIYHDESIFNTNEGQTWMWGTDDNPAILPKTKGSGIMVSDFVEEHGGYLCLSEDELGTAAEIHSNFPYEAREFLKYGAERDGYWTSEKFILHVRIAEFKYNPAMHTIVRLFDHSSCHTAYAPDALNARKMNVNPGGVQPLMRDTVWEGRVQRMVFSIGNVAKDMKKVLEERGINTTSLRADDMRKILANLFFLQQALKVKLVKSVLLISSAHQPEP